MKQLQKLLSQVDGKGYKAYKSIQGRYSFHRFELIVDYVQGDPFASPSKIRIIIPEAYRKVKDEWKTEKHKRTYVEDLIARYVASAIDNNAIQGKGSGKSGMIAIDCPGQQILERTAVSIDPNHITICLSVGLPANGRRINGKEAEKIFFQAIPNIMSQSIFTLKDSEIDQVVQLAEQHQVIRQQMNENGWVSFIADGAILPRQSGVSDKPLKSAIPFESPVEDRVSIDIPYREQPLTGMAIKKGVTLIVGGGYHGKSTLLNAVERGVYHHIHGDGREYVLTDPKAAKVRAEDGRQVTNVDISAFINDLPHKQDTKRFTTENASGSTSQAANVVEALESGATSVLIDEDTSATNFMIRDGRMQELVVKEKEPITPFIDKIQQMRDELDISTVLVMGGSGDYFDVADHVIMMDQYLPHNVTEKAKQIADKYPTARREYKSGFGSLPSRQFLPNSLQTRRGKKSKVQAKGLTTIIMGRTDISLHYVEQLIDSSQTRMIAEIIQFLDKKGMLKREMPLSQLLDQIENQMEEKGLGSFAPFPDQHPGELARPRRFEIAATLNRIRTAKVKDISAK
ncbi:ABC-ATPase domain-containing protein [Aquibacillus albus]|uniref:ABC-class ATPase n=1 Tax=Aquibacillus albus TaxID=1168171 RepID=A0ABS2N0E4_9BACI|nr:ABC-ATPase domain-containing protein [Aquibacillus albus]MBM7571633.1 putative ABC-class ATPase [Aquibacillus albus]